MKHKKASADAAGGSGVSDDRRLIEEWLPIAALGEECVRERRSMTALPPTYYLHVWWARRPLVASRAAVLASLLPADADRAMFMRVLGIHGDPVAARRAMDEAVRTGVRVENPYGYNRAFSYVPDEGERCWIRDQVAPLGIERPTILDPTAGGGSIPFETARLRLDAIGNDLNPVAWLILKATVEFPMLHGRDVLARYQTLAVRWRASLQGQLARFYPASPDPMEEDATFLWARTIRCPYCGALAPLSPNWRLNGKGAGVRLVPHAGSGPGDRGRHCTFEMVGKDKDHSAGTVKGGAAVCPWRDCANVIDGDEIKRQAQAGEMGQQLYCVVFNRRVVVGHTKAGKEKVKKERGFRAPRPSDDVEAQVKAALDAKMPEWIARDIVPTEDVPEGLKTREPRNYGMKLWRDMFAPRQLLGHGTSVEVFHDLVEELREEHGGTLPEVDKAALAYLAIAIDKMLDWNSRQCTWEQYKQAMAHTFHVHGFPFISSFSEMAPMVAGLGYDWALGQVAKALKELIALARGDDESEDDKDLVDAMSPAKDGGDAAPEIRILCGSAAEMDLADESVDAIVMDPPYYDNVMYAELADFFYVWLKRTAGLLFPEPFYGQLTDKDREAVANPARFKGQAGGAKNLAGYDYQSRMAAVFRECRRVLKPNGVMTVMFTHKASGAWDALATGLVLAGFSITASWPVQTEAEGSLHIKEKNAAKSTIFLVCRPRAVEDDGAEPRYWEDVEPLVRQRVRERVAEFQGAGIGGVDLYLACFGPALQVYSENWPLQRGRPVPKPAWFDEDLFMKWDPYRARPEDALDEARREVKRWRMDHLTKKKRAHHLDPLTEWYILAWDAFRAPKFPTDEALKLARVVGLDFDAEVKNQVCEVKASDVVLWDSVTRQAKGRLGEPGGSPMLDTLHRAAAAGRKSNTGAAKGVVEDAGLLQDPTLLTGLEALLNVLPPLRGSDFEALDNLRKLAFREVVPEPEQTLLELCVDDPGEAEEDDGE